MQHTWLAGGVVTVILVGSSLTWGQATREAGGDGGRTAAQEARGTAGRDADAGAAREARRNSDATSLDLASVAAELNLTADQQARITEKINAMKTALADWEKQNQDKINKARADAQAADQAGDHEGARKAIEQVRPLAGERLQIETDFQSQVMDVLTPEQRAAYAGLKMLQDREFIAMLKAINPTPEQETQLKDKAKAMGAALAKWDYDNGANVRTLEKQVMDAQAALQPLRDQRDKLTADQRTALLTILTPDQKVALTAARLQEQVTGGRERSQLTDEQVAKVKAICEQAVKDAGPTIETDRNAAEALRSKVAQAIRDQVLTDAQRAQLDAAGKR